MSPRCGACPIDKVARRRSSRQSGRARYGGLVFSRAEQLLRGCCVRGEDADFPLWGRQEAGSFARGDPTCGPTRTSTQRLSATTPVPCILFAPAVRAVT